MRKPLTDVEQPLFVTRGCQPAFVGVKNAQAAGWAQRVGSYATAKRRAR
jgi:hypothetical protein